MKKAGFTLVEILIVVSIIVIACVSGGVSIRAHLKVTKHEEAREIMEIISAAANSYCMRNGSYADTSAGLIDTNAINTQYNMQVEPSDNPATPAIPNDGALYTYSVTPCGAYPLLSATAANATGCVAACAAAPTCTGAATPWIIIAQPVRADSLYNIDQANNNPEDTLYLILPCSI
ncbi:MAG: prepilin-type N-terminal cleavage/methylation domain-containing protein [Pseudomonadota bacterium]